MIIKNSNNLKIIGRNVFALKYGYNFPIWKRQLEESTISKEYKYIPNLIEESIIWNTSINTGAFIYSDDSFQKAVILNTGPLITIGKFKRRFADFTKIKLDISYPLKNGEIPFAFDDINDNQRLNINLSQQIFGPLLFSYETSMNLESDNEDYGSFSKPKYRLDLKRRAYSIGAFYHVPDKIFGIGFNVFNFDYFGSSKKFNKN